MTRVQVGVCLSFSSPLLSDLTGRAVWFASGVGAQGTTPTVCRINSCYVSWQSQMFR